jgi:hypothetical protein
MTNFNIDIQIVDSKRVVTDTSIDYLPFGVKTLKLQIRKIAGPAQKVWIRTRRFKRDQDPCAIYGLADDGEDLWAIWGAGDITGFCAKYAERAGTKKAVVLDDDTPHTVYLHLIHHPADPIHHQLRDRRITIVAVTSEVPNDLSRQSCTDRQYQDTIVAEKTFTLVVPEGVTNPLRPIWDWQPDASHITFSGDEVPRYTSRWWPSCHMDYTRANDTPRIALDYERVANVDREGKITVWLERDHERVCLAEVAGHLTIPVYDLRWFLPELYRFYDYRLYVLRLWFFWTDEHIDADDLLSFVPDSQKDELREQKTNEAADLMRPKLLGISGIRPGWDRQYEIPDIERFDIVFDPNNLTEKYGCTDAHWRELWFTVDKGQPCQCRIAAPKDALAVLLSHLGPGPGGKVKLVSMINPLEEGGLVSTITNNRCCYDTRLKQIVLCKPGDPIPRAAGFLGKNAPSVANSQMMENGLSSDVLQG